MKKKNESLRDDDDLKWPEKRCVWIEYVIGFIPTIVYVIKALIAGNLGESILIGIFIFPVLIFLGLILLKIYYVIMSKCTFDSSREEYKEQSKLATACIIGGAAYLGHTTKKGIKETEKSLCSKK